MQNEELYPELIDYIYQFETRFMNADERVAAGIIIVNSKEPAERFLEAAKLKREMMQSETRKQMLADGYEAFKNRVVNRIYSQHKHELALNLCPRCGKIARTPFAKQCRFCFYDWHNPDRIKEIS